jgi:hypothetical protein
LSTPNKPGKDLSALKARLAKKASGDEAPAAAPPAPAADAAVPAPGEVMAPAPAPMPVEIPPPGEVSVPAPAASAPPARAAYAAAPDAHDDNAPFAARATGFDPDAGVLPDVGGDVAPRKNTGLIILVGVAGLAVGVGVGMLLQRINDTSKRITAAQSKGAEMVEAANKTQEARGKVALAIDEIAKQVTSDPKAAVTTIQNLVDNELQDLARADKYFGWQFASMNPEAIKLVFKYYEDANALDVDLRYLGGYVANNEAALKAAANAPVVYGVLLAQDGATLVELRAAYCDITDPKAPKACEAGKEAEVTGYGVRDSLGGEESVVAKEGFLMLKPGGLTSYFFTENPNRLAFDNVVTQLARIKQRADDMAGAYKRVSAALEQYSGSPDVDGSNPQPPPSE